MKSDTDLSFYKDFRLSELQIIYNLTLLFLYGIFSHFVSHGAIFVGAIIGLGFYPLFNYYDRTRVRK